MDTQFEVDGRIIETADLTQAIGSEALARLLGRIVAQIERDVDPVCEIHGEGPAVTIVTMGTQLTGVRVAGCCKHFVEHVQEQIQTVFVEQTPKLLPAGTPGTILVVRLVSVGKEFVFDTARIRQVVIGRHDASTGIRPEVDLSAYGAYENGVSRRHATILLSNQGLYVIDEGSPNGTFLNETRLASREPYALKFGDRIRIGRLVLEVSLDNPSDMDLP